MYIDVDFCQSFALDGQKSCQTEEQMKQRFPMEFISSDYCYLSPTIQFPQASVVTLHVKFTFISIIF